MYSRRILMIPTNFGYFTGVQNPRQIYNITKIRNCTKNTYSRIYSLCNKKFDSPTGMPGSGAGKGGGGGGSVRESGGKFGEYGAAQEEHYFFNKQKEQLEKMKKKLKSDKAGEMNQNEEK